MVRKNCLSCGLLINDLSLVKTREKKCPKCSKSDPKIIVYYICPRCGNNIGKKN